MIGLIYALLNFRFINWNIKILIPLKTKLFSILESKATSNDYVALQFLRNAINIQNNDFKIANKLDTPVNIVITSTKKDLEITKYSIKYALKALKNLRVKNTYLIVPSNDLNSFKFLNKQINNLILIDEDTLEIAKLKKTIMEKFQDRGTWVFQQFIKLELCITNKNDYSLIIDADTLLLNPRNWINNQNQIILCPSYEYNDPYYKFLYKLNINIKKAEYSFVSHHIFIDPKYLSEIQSKLNKKNFLELAEYLIAEADSEDFSSMSVDYELYAQYVYSNKDNQFILSKWSNQKISRKYAKFLLKNKFFLVILSLFFNSISFHSWS